MRTKYLLTFLVTCILLLTKCSLLYPQTSYWDRTQRVTSGFIDKNPSFDTKRPVNFGAGNFAFLVFERWTMLMNSNICVIKFGFDSAFGGVQYITNDSKMNRNPRTAFNNAGGFGNNLTNAMIVWEVYENSRWNIYGATYNNNAWTVPYPIDTTAGDKHNPDISYNSASSSNYLYSIVYEKNGDIIYKNFESVLKTTLNEFNLTSAEPEICRNPGVTSPIGYALPHFVSYEKQKPNGDYGLYHKRAYTSYVWTGDTLSTVGAIKNSNIAAGFSSIISTTYESNKSGKWGIYATDYSPYSGISQSYTVYQSPAFNYRNAMNFMFPLITDYSGYMHSCVKQTVSATKIMTANTSFANFLDSITVGDSSSKTVMTLGNGIYQTNTFRYMVWMVFDKDSANLSTLNARGKIILIASVNRISSEVPEKFSLSQNYPNPFNPGTIISFQLPTTNYINLTVYNLVGKEVAVLVKEQLSAGIYNIEWNASAYPSGIYFCKMKTNGFSQTIKMLLTK